MLAGHRRVVAVTDDRDDLVGAGSETLERIRRVTRADVNDVRVRRRNDRSIGDDGGVEEDVIVTNSVSFRAARLLDRNRTLLRQLDGDVSAGRVAVLWRNDDGFRTGRGSRSGGGWGRGGRGSRGGIGLLFAAAARGQRESSKCEEGE